MSIIIFSLKLGWFPASGLDTWKGWVLPVFSLAIGPIASVARMTRSSMLEVIRQDYIRTARAKGLKQSAVTRRHALKNGLIPVITVVGSQLSQIMGGSILVETIFSIPGLGTLMNTAISSKNYPVVQSGILMISVTVCIMNLVVDLAYAFFDPRIKAQYTGTKKKKKEPEETQPAAQEVA
jgi:peptide/nickel transport system permease protein